MITEEQLQRVIPKKARGAITPELIGTINKLVTDPIVREVYRDNLLGYASVMGEGKFKLPDYVNAVRYVTFKLHSSSNIEAYVKTFPDRYQTFLNDGVSEKDISSYVSAYNKNRLVNLVWAQTLVPVAILNADNLQKAINTQVEIMTDKSIAPRDRTAAANSVMTHLNRPEAQKLELEISNKEDKSIVDLRNSMDALRDQQRDIMLNNGMNARDVAHSELVIQGTCETVD